MTKIFPYVYCEIRWVDNGGEAGLYYQILDQIFDSVECNF